MTSTCGNLSYNLTSNLCGSPFIWPNIHGSWWHSNTHRIHGTGIFTYIYLPKINHSWIGKYTVRPMDPSWDIHGNAKTKTCETWLMRVFRSAKSLLHYLNVSKNRGVYPQNGWFINYKSSILGYPYFWKHSGSGVNGKPYQNGWFGGFSHIFGSTPTWCFLWVVMLWFSQLPSDLFLTIFGGWNTHFCVCAHQIVGIPPYKHEQEYYELDHFLSLVL